MYVCTYVRTYVCLFVCLLARVHRHTHTYIYNVRLCIHPSIHTSIHPYVSPSICPPIHLCICLSLLIFVCTPPCQSIFPPVCPSVCQPVRECVCIFLACAFLCVCMRMPYALHCIHGLDGCMQAWMDEWMYVHDRPYVCPEAVLKETERNVQIDGGCCNGQ